jgi:MscS family membrane protein
MRRLAAVLTLLLIATFASAQERMLLLKPPDLSSPRATLKTFLESGDELAGFLAKDYLPAPTREKFGHASSLASRILRALDLSEVPPAARRKTGVTAATALYEVLSRLALPSFEEIPDAEQIAARPGANAKRWAIPNTEIVLVRAESGPRAGDFLFSADTVAHAADFYARVRGLPYARPVPLENMHELLSTGGGWMFPYASIRALPSWLRVPLADQALWKWIGLALTLGAYALVLWLAYRASQLGRGDHPLRKALPQLALPVTVLVATPVATYFALMQILLGGGVASAVELAATAIMFIAGAWTSWRFATVAAESIISSPIVGHESMDAHMIRVGARLLGIVGGAALLVVGADRLGIPLYGIVAGLGVGGLAIALAAQPSIENLIGSMNLFADIPLRVGDFCKYGDQSGTVEAIGIRSARIRGLDRTLTTIPNAALAKMPIVNFARRDKILINSIIGLRYETTPEQLQQVLARLREMLLGHPRVDPGPARARLVAFGASSLDVELFAYVLTADWTEFLRIREDILLRVMEIVDRSGTAMAFPSQTIYLGRDQKPDLARTAGAEAEVRAMRQEGSLPMSNLSPEQAIRGSVNFPRAGSAPTNDAKPRDER